MVDYDHGVYVFERGDYSLTEIGYMDFADKCLTDMCQFIDVSVPSNESRHVRHFGEVYIENTIDDGFEDLLSDLDEDLDEELWIEAIITDLRGALHIMVMDADGDTDDYEAGDAREKQQYHDEIFNRDEEFIDE